MDHKALFLEKFWMLQQKVPSNTANIVLNNATDSSQVTGTISQSDGSFRLENLRPGAYYVEVYFLGYQTQRINDVQISRRKPTVDVGNILIRQSTVSMNAVEVEGEKAPISYQIDKKVINVEGAAHCNFRLCGGCAGKRAVYPGGYRR
ncbi:MAG: carboxypeptidase-like regulatory domain-containing protein [Calditrichia bacterium]